MAHENALGVQAPYFFLSYHRTPSDGSNGANSHVVKLYKDLCRHIRHMTDLSGTVAPGYLDQNMPAGIAWRATVKGALATCQTFVALYEPRYFHSEFCGYEWACFEARQAEARPPGSVAYGAIIPVLMAGEKSLPTPLPRCAAELQYSDPRLPGAYIEHGIWGLQYTSLTAYRKSTLAIAGRIVEVAKSTLIAPCSTDVFDDGADAFADWRQEREG